MSDIPLDGQTPSECTVQSARNVKPSNINGFEGASAPFFSGACVIRSDQVHYPYLSEEGVWHGVSTRSST